MAKIFFAPRRLVVSTLVAMLAILAACGSASSSTASGPVNLTLWSFNDNQKEIDLYQQSHPNVHITLQKLPSKDYYAKLQTAIKAGNAPDIAQVEYQFLPTIISTGGLVDLTKYGAANVQSQFVPWTWGQVSQSGKVYAIPQDTGPTAMFYRTDVFAKYGIAVPTTWDEFAAAAAKLHAADPKAYLTDFPPGEAGWFFSLLWQADSHPFGISGDAWKVSLNDANAKKVTDYWQGLISKKLVKTEPDFSDAWNADLQSGNVATWITAVWGGGFLASAAPQATGKWKVAPLPQWTAGGKAAGNWGGSSFAVTKSSKNAKAAADFLTWWNTDPSSISLLVKENGLYPAATAGLSDAGLKAPQPYFQNQVTFDTFAAASPQVNTTFQWGPTMTQVFTDLSDNFGKAADGSTTLSAALDAVQQSTVQNMQSQGFTVQP